MQNGTLAIDTAPPAGLLLDYKTLVACPASSLKNILCFMAALDQHFVPGIRKLAHCF